METLKMDNNNLKIQLAANFIIIKKKRIIFESN